MFVFRNERTKNWANYLRFQSMYYAKRSPEKWLNKCKRNSTHEWRNLWKQQISKWLERRTAQTGKAKDSRRKGDREFQLKWKIKFNVTQMSYLKVMQLKVKSRGVNSSASFKEFLLTKSDVKLAKTTGTVRKKQHKRCWYCVRARAQNGDTLKVLLKKNWFEIASASNPYENILIDKPTDQFMAKMAVQDSLLNCSQLLKYFIDIHEKSAISDLIYYSFSRGLLLPTDIFNVQQTYLYAWL